MGSFNRRVGSAQSAQADCSDCVCDVYTSTERNGGRALSRFCSNIFSITRGTMPRFADVAVLWPDVVPIVNVLPEPVCPYASTVALYPAKMPSSRGKTLVL